MDDKIMQLAADGALTTERVQSSFHVSRATAARRLQALVKSGLLERRGAGRATVYAIARRRFRWRRAGLDEHAAWKQIEPAVRSLANLEEHEVNTINYAVTEMINNAIDHSAGTSVRVEVSREHDEIAIDIVDDGIGVFENVQTTFKLESVDDAVVQLEKGKLTTQPQRHSGQGLFFTSKAVQRFRLVSDSLAWLVENRGVGPLASEQTTEKLAKSVNGTRVELRFVPGRIPELAMVFAGWAEPGGEFDTTRTTVKLAQRGKALISRSEAKRVVAGLEKFKQVILDFTDVDVVGQGFVDEVFRVFADAHPTTKLEPRTMNASVAFMVGRALPADLTRLPADPFRRSVHFHDREPERYRRAVDRLLGITPATRPYDRLLLSVSALLGAFRVDPTVSEPSQFRALVSANAEQLLATYWRAGQRLLNLDEIAVSVSDAAKAQALSLDVLERVRSEPECWRYFSDDDGITAFWRLDADVRRRVWGPEIELR